jgi:hypothetical protein
VAIACGGASRLLVIDIDPDKGGRAEFGEKREQTVPATLVSMTPRGGLHLYLRVPKDRPLPGNSVGTKLGFGIDTRCERGFVLAPPSTVVQILPDGRRHYGFYRWSPDSVDQIAEAPEWLLDRLDAPGNGTATDPREWMQLVTEGVDQGQRNQHIAKLAGLLFRYLPPTHAETAAELVSCWNEVRCRPPLPVEEVWRTLDSIAAAELCRRGLDR